MSATMTAPEQIDGLEKLITLASLRKEDIIATQTEARKQLQLTQEEQGKVAEAKAYIAKHATVAAEMTARENKLATDQAAHNQAVGDFSTHVNAENIRLETFSATLAAKEKELETGWKNLADAQGTHKATVDEHARQNQEAVNKNIAAAAENTRVRTANETEAGRLADWDALLKAKAKRLRDAGEREAA